MAANVILILRLVQLIFAIIVLGTIAYGGYLDPARTDHIGC